MAMRAAVEAMRGRRDNAVQAVRHTFLGVQELFERHNVVFTIGGTLLSGGAAWAGYTARQMHQRKLEERLKSIEHAMTNVHNLEEQQVKVLADAVKSGLSYKACFATAGTALVLGYGLGFRRGRLFTLRRLEKAASSSGKPGLGKRLLELRQRSGEVVAGVKRTEGEGKVSIENAGRNQSGQTVVSSEAQGKLS